MIDYTLPQLLDEIIKAVRLKPWTQENKNEYYHHLAVRIKEKIIETLYLGANEGNQKKLEKLAENFDLIDYLSVVEEQSLEGDIIKEAEPFLTLMLEDELSHLLSEDTIKS